MTTPNYQVPEWEAPRPSTSKSSTGFSQHNSAPPLPGVLPSTAAKEEAPPPAYDGVVAHPPRPTLRQRFDLLFPPHRRYIRGRLTRRLFLFVLFASFFILLSLILGLAIGLSRRTCPPPRRPRPRRLRHHLLPLRPHLRRLPSRVRRRVNGEQPQRESALWTADQGSEV
jgi:hypothetical protein